MLRDGRAALRYLFALPILLNRLLHRLHIDAAVFVEGVVFGHQDRTAQIRRDAAVWDGLIVERVVLARRVQLLLPFLHECGRGRHFLRQGGDVGKGQPLVGNERHEQNGDDKKGAFEHEARFYLDYVE